MIAQRDMLILKTDFNIECIHQVPCSPFINTLNHSVCTTLQSVVERRHFTKHCHVEALVSTVMTTWDEGKLDRQITNVFKRLEKLLCLINEGEGGNDLVELKRGKKNRNLKFDLILNQINIEKSQEGIVVTANIEEHAIGVHVENDDKELVEFDEVVV